MTDDWNALAASGPTPAGSGARRSRVTAVRVGIDDEPDHGLRDPVVRDAWWSLLEPELPPAPASVADLACGTGSLSLLLAERGYEVTGVDLAPAMLERASTKLGDRARFLLGDVTAPPLRDGGFDVVLARHILFALDDPAAAIARWTRLLAPAGRLLLVEGFWHAGAGMRAEEVERIVRTSRAEAVVTRLDEAPDLWGGPVADERFLVASRR